MQKGRIIIYQLLPRLFGNRHKECIPGGDIHRNGCGKFSDITSQAIQDIKSLGITHIWYTGVLEHASRTDYSKFGIAPDNKSLVKGEAGSPYAIRDYYDITPDLADNITNRRDEFASLIKRTHKENIKVIIDFIPNHVARYYKSDNRPERTFDFGHRDDTNQQFTNSNNFYYLGNTDFSSKMGNNQGLDSYSENPLRATGNDCFNAPTRNDWYDTVKLNYGIDYRDMSKHFSPIPNTWIKMLKILLYWASQGVDGFRCDMVELTPVEFWQWAIPRIKEQYPQIIFIAEIYKPTEYRSYINDGGFDYLYDKVGLYDILRGIICGHTSANDITNCWLQTNDIKDKMLAFLENHDEQRIASDFFAGNGSHALAAILVMATMGKNPLMIYFGQELGERGMDVEGFSGLDGRTTIFDYWSINTIRRRNNDGKFNDEHLTADERILRNWYKKLLTICNTEKAITNGDFFDIQYHNQNNGNYDSNSIYSFLRAGKNELILIVANFGNSSRTCSVNIPQEAFSYLNIPCAELPRLVTELLSEQSFEYTLAPDKPIKVELPAKNGIILKFKFK